MSESKRYASADELLYCGVDYKNNTNKADADTDSCSDIDDFERLSIPDSEPMSGDEAVVDAAHCGHTLNGVDTKRSSETAQIVPFSFTVHKPPIPPTTLTLPMPSVRTEVCRQAGGLGRVERSVVFNELVTLANNIDQLMVGEIRMNFLLFL